MEIKMTKDNMMIFEQESKIYDLIFANSYYNDGIIYTY